MRGSCQPQRVQMMILLYVDDSFQIHTEQAHWEASLLLLQHVKASDFCQHNSPLCVIIPWVVPIARYHFPYSTVYALKSPTTRISDMFLQILWCDHTMAGKMILLEGHILNNSLNNRFCIFTCFHSIVPDFLCFRLIFLLQFLKYVGFPYFLLLFYRNSWDFCTFTCVCSIIVNSLYFPFISLLLYQNSIR